MSKSWQEFFENFSYKPNWRFEVRKPIYAIYNDSFVLEIVMMVPDSRTPRRLPEALPWGERTQIPLVPISRTVILDRWMGEEHAKNLTREYIRMMEEHEIDEWFRYKGELTFDPHKDE